jgi:Tfp pilus assembly protein PilW
MKRWVQTAATRLRDREDGLTLIEILVASTMLLALLTGVLAVLISAMHSENTSQDFSQEIEDAQTGVARMLHDVRQADRVLIATRTTIRFVKAGSTETVTQYECDVPKTGTPFTRCTRVQAPLPAGQDPNAVSLPAATTGAPVVERVTNGSSVFSYTAPGQAGTDSAGQPVDSSGAPLAPTYVDAQIAVPSAGELAGSRLAQMTHTTVLSSGAYLRNADL